MYMCIYVYVYAYTCMYIYTHVYMHKYGGHPDARARDAAHGVTPNPHPAVGLRANLESISYRCRLFEVAFVWELTKETIRMPLGCLQGGLIVQHVDDALC